MAWKKRGCSAASCAAGCDISSAPFVLLSASSPPLQAWKVRALRGRGVRVGGLSGGSAARRRGFNRRLFRERRTLTHLSDALLEAIIEEANDDNTIALALGGSYARGTPTPFSDIDIARFVRVLPERYNKRFYWRDGRIVNISTKSFERELENVKHPENAILLIPAFLEARALLDKTGEFAAFQQALRAITWESMQPAADHYASDAMMLIAEDAHKILSALYEGNAEGLAYAAIAIFRNLTHTLAVQRGVWVKTTSTYLQQVEERVGADSAWTRCHRLAGGIDPTPAASDPLRARTIAGLRLYAESAALLDPILLPAHRDVVENTVRVIHETLATEQER